MDIKNFLGELGEKTRDFVVRTIPLSEKQKKEHMQMIEERKDFYQPRIEEKTGVSLGKIYVLPNMLDFYQRAYETHTNLFDCALEANENRPIKSEFVKTLMPLFTIPTVAILGTIALWHVLETEHQAYLAAGKDKILVPFGRDSRKWIYDQAKDGHSCLDEAVVHELSHILWDKLEKKDSSQHIGFRVLNEGFTTYCHQSYFSDLYPAGYTLRINPGGIYKSGKEIIESMIKRYGPSILMRIPSEWQKLVEQELRKNNRAPENYNKVPLFK